MTFTQSVAHVMRNYVTFSGRASRSEYWYFVLFAFLGAFLLGLVDRAVFGTTLVETGPGTARLEANGPLAGIFSLLTLIPMIAAGWRRMHDTGRSGLYLIYPLIVMAGIFGFMTFMVGIGPMMAGDYASIVAGASTVVMFVAAITLMISPLLVLWWLARPSQPGPNAYGPNPHEVIQ
ncbi:DUF805 domain-containing protein [Profundibacterium mesophilum]|uniref:Inner membrane protein n=1 Tax=Profundibacterium mesophilum KAUST100406-0324 TaxID=1037889 RepID=A0A921TE05_9RHOB|nr:DUF805 domain-containing protein [Profundibacterium mesophilum]KAF0677353.1 putative inner membrane protein [Profundibacterium mesophilum KAUST100406-0324]